MRSAIVLLFGIACGVTSPAAAQAELEVAPYIGLYWPTNALGSGGGDTTVKQRSSVVRGMRVTQWLRGRLGFEGTIGYARSSLVSSWVYYGGPVYPAHVLTASAVALLRVTPPNARAGLHVGGGVGVVGHGGDAYHSDSYDGPTTFFGGIASVGAAIQLARWLRLRFDADDFVYSAHLGPCTRSGPGYGGVCDVFSENAGRTTNSRLQNDLVLSLGFALVARE